jgi:thiamine biosynthesis lipoprotein
MKETRLLMGMPITVEVIDPGVRDGNLEDVFTYLVAVDEAFSPYKASSEVSRLNRGELPEDQYSEDLKTILALSEQTRIETHGYFDIWSAGICDPSGIVKGWAVQQAARILETAGCRNFYVDAGGDMQVCGMKEGRPWRVGIRNPFNRNELVKVLALSDCGVATSGTAIRGQHIYDPHDSDKELLEILSITVIGTNVYDADRFATAAFAMQCQGICFIEALPDFEGYMIDANARATYTSGFERYVQDA